MVKFKTTHDRKSGLRNGVCKVSLFFVVLTWGAVSHPQFAQQDASNPDSTDVARRQLEIDRQRIRLQSSDVEERRDAVMRLGSMRHPDSSRVAAAVLNDPVPIVRATTAGAVLSLPAEEAVTLLIPLLKDKNEFVRQQVAYALGETRSSSAVNELVAALLQDKKPSVRGASAVALGVIGDVTASGALARVVNPGFTSSDSVNQKPKQKKEEDQFVISAAARSLGQMRSRSSVPALIAAMANKRLGVDVKREIVVSLGLIGDASAVPVIRESLTSTDPYLARNAYEALQRISAINVTQCP